MSISNAGMIPMSESPLFTVLTSTRNRAHLLPRAYESLKRQTLRDFEWLVVDNDSTDNTRQLVQAWCEEANDFPIRYCWQKDAHVKGSYNRAVREARGELLPVLDDDDELLPEALETLKRVWFDIPEDDRGRYCGVTALCVDPAGNVVGSRFPTAVFDSNSLELLFRYRVVGEKFGFVRVDVLKQYPFPEDVDGYLNENFVWNRISRKFLIRYVNVPVRIFYPGGLTSGRDHSVHSDGSALYARETLEHDWKWIRVNPLAILKQAALYTYFSLHLAARQKGKRWPLQGLVPRLLVAMMWPIGFALYRRDIHRPRHG